MQQAPRGRRALAAAAFAAATPAALAAQVTLAVDAARPPRPIEGGLSIGATVASGDLADFTGSGYALSGLLQSTAGRALGVRAEFSYASFNGDRLPVPGLRVPVPDTRILAGTLSAVIAPGARRVRAGRVRAVRPYVIAGVGLYNRDSGDADDADAVNEPARATDFGINAGVGLRVPVGRVNTFLEARVHNVFGANEATRYFAPIKAGVAF